MAIDFKTISADTTFGSGAFLFGADSQSASEPSLYSESTVFGYLLGLANTWTNNQTINTGQKTASAPILDMSQTWNNGAVTFTGIKSNVTDTASASSSLLLDLQVGGASRFRVKKDGSLTIPNLASVGTTGFPGVSPGVGIVLKSGNIQLYTNEIDTQFRFSNSPSRLMFGSLTQLAWSDTTDINASASDTLLTRRGAASLRLGAADAASPVAQTLGVQSVVAGTTNTAGANFTIAGSQGTGTGAGGSIIFQVAPAGSSGTAQNALATALTIGSDLNITLSSAPTITWGTSGSQFLTFRNNATNLLAIDYNFGLKILSGAFIGFTSSGTSSTTADLVIARDAANTLALRNGTAAQRFNLYKTFTDASNYARLVIDAGSVDSNTFCIWGQSAGTGSYLTVDFGFSNTKLLRFDNTNATLFGLNLLFFADNTYDIGASGSNRPRNVYVGTNGYWGTPQTPNWWSSSRVIQVGHAALFNSGSAVTSAMSLSSNLHETGGGSVYIATGYAAKYDQSTGAHIWYTAPSGSANAALTFTEYLRLTNSGLLTFGGTTSSFPALKRSSTVLQARLADDSDFAPLQGQLRTHNAYTAGAPTATGYIVLYDSTGTAYKVPAEAL